MGPTAARGEHPVPSPDRAHTFSAATRPSGAGPLPWHGQLAYGQQSDSHIDEVFLLSDGEPTAGPVTDPDLILRLVAEANRYLRTRINTVFAGRGKGAALMRRLAEQNEGVFVQR